MDGENNSNIAGKELLDQLTSNINSNFRELKDELKSVKEENNQIKSRIENTKPPEKDVDFDSSDDFLWDSKKVEQIVESKVEKKLSSHRKQDEFKASCIQWDRQMIQDFTDEAGASLFQNNLDFKTEVEKEVNKLMLVQDPAGNYVYPPDGLYNSASRVYARWMRSNKLKPTPEHDDMEPLNFGGGGSASRGGRVHPAVQAGRTEAIERLRLSDTQIKRAYSSSLANVDNRGRSPRRVTVYNRKQREAIR